MMNAKPSPVTASTLYPSTLLHAYPRVTTLPESIYNSAAAYVNAQGYLPFAPTPESSAFYAPLNAADCGDAWRSLTAQTAAAAAAAAWVYEPSIVGYPYPASYGNLDVRRKNATRESTSTLKAWLYEHIKNPYPTKGEKIMLAIITKMTLTQVSTWFANARRRLKKENKMQWSPRNRTGDDDDDDDDDKNSDNDDVIIGERASERDENALTQDEDEDIVVDAGNDDFHPGPHGRCVDLAPDLRYSEHRDVTVTPSTVQRPECTSSRPEAETQRNRPIDCNIRTSGENASTSGICKDGGGGVQPTGTAASEKPRIWSLADVATSNTPPGGGCRRSPSNAELPVKVNDLLTHHRFAHELSRPPPTDLSTSVSCPSIALHHSFQPWTKRFFSSSASASAAPHHSIHPFANKLLPRYVPYPPPIALSAHPYRGEDPCANSGANRGGAPVDGASRAHALPAAAAIITGSSLLSPNHPLHFAAKANLTNGFNCDEKTTPTISAVRGSMMIKYDPPTHPPHPPHPQHPPHPPLGPLNTTNMTSSSSPNYSPSSSSSSSLTSPSPRSPPIPAPPTSELTALNSSSSATASSSSSSIIPTSSMSSISVQKRL